MEDEGRKSRRSSCGRHCEQARRLMRVSTTLPHSETEFDDRDSFERPKRGSPRPEEVSNLKNKDRNRKSVEPDDCDDEYMLQNLHNLKRFIRRVWSYAWCYTQYCYPGLRTSEYYKKVKRVCQEREKVDKEKKKKEKKDKNKDGKNKDKKDDKKKLEYTNPQINPTYLSSGVASGSFLSDSSTQTSDEDRSDLDDLDDDDDTHDRRPKAKKRKTFAKPLKILPALEEELGWGGFVVKSFRQLSSTISNFISETDQGYRISAVVKVVCLLLAPAVIWLGVNYVFLKRKYKSLSGKLRRIKEENNVLKKDCSKLESILSSTEKLKMPFSTKESRQQVVAEFTRLAESRMKSKKEITRLTTEKQALLEELKMAKKQRDVARNQYSSLAQGVIETNKLPYLQT